jgi:hypothetical protein
LDCTDSPFEASVGAAMGSGKIEVISIARKVVAGEQLT